MMIRPRKTSAMRPMLRPKMARRAVCLRSSTLNSPQRLSTVVAAKASDGKCHPCAQPSRRGNRSARHEQARGKTGGIIVLPETAGQARAVTVGRPPKNLEIGHEKIVRFVTRFAWVTMIRFDGSVAGGRLADFSEGVFQTPNFRFRSRAGGAYLRPTTSTNPCWAEGPTCKRGETPGAGRRAAHFNSQRKPQPGRPVLCVMRWTRLTRNRASFRRPPRWGKR